MATRNSLLDDGTSEATKNAQPSKDLNGGSAKIDGANPSSPSTNNATRREEYATHGTASQDYQNLAAQLGYGTVANVPETPKIETPKTQGTDLTIKGNFDLYNPVDRENQPTTLQQYYVQANNDMKASKRALSQLILQQDALNAKSSNVNQVTTLIDAIENAYDRGVFDTKTIANTLGVDENIISLIQQGKANELVTLDQEFVQDQLKSYYRAEEDYDINLKRNMENYNLAMTNLNNQYNSAMQTLKRSLFDEKWTASVGSAVAGISGSEYAVRVIEAKHQQNIDDLNNSYIYSTLQQQYSYTRAIEDYNKNIQRLSEDFDDALKDIQASVLQQFQEIDNKIGLTTAQLAQAYGTLEQNVATAKATAVTNYITALSSNESGLADAIANAYGLDTSTLGVHQFTSSELGRTWKETIGNATNNIGHILASNDGSRIGTYKSPNGYTYNVYATREEGLQATLGLLQRAYYGMTLQDAAQKWIGQGKDISAAKSVIKGLGLDLNEKLSDANVEKFITAMGRWEGTLGQNETLEQWLAGGQDLSSYGSKKKTTTTGGEEGQESVNYVPGYEADYRNRLTNGTKGFTAAAKKTIESEFGSWGEFVANAEAYKPQLKKEDRQIIENGLSMVDSIISEYEEATKDMSDTMIAEATAAFSLDDTNQIKIAAIQKYPKLYTAYSRYQQYIAQGFIDTIISSKKSGATYGQLSDKEGNKLQAAFTPTKINMPKDEFLRLMREAQADLRGDVVALGGKNTWSTLGTRRTKQNLDTLGYLEAIANIYGNSNININESVTGGFDPIQTNRQFNTGSGANANTGRVTTLQSI